MARGKASIVKVLIAHPAVRRAVVQNAKRAAASANSALAKRGVTLPSSGRGNPLDAGTLTNVLGSVAKPVAEKLAKNEIGRSVLRTISDVSAEALGEKGKRPESPLNSFLTKLAGAAAAASARSKGVDPQATPRGAGADKPSAQG